MVYQLVCKRIDNILPRNALRINQQHVVSSVTGSDVTIAIFESTLRICRQMIYDKSIFNICGIIYVE